MDFYPIQEVIDKNFPSGPAGDRGRLRYPQIFKMPIDECDFYGMIEPRIDILKKRGIAYEIGRAHV